MENDRQLAALRRLMADASVGEQAKLDAVLAISQRTLYAVPWPRAEDGLRTLISSGGESALPLFSSVGELEAAVDRFGWRSPDGSTPSREVAAKEAFRYARDRNLLFVVVDIASDHTLEVSRTELEPLLAEGSLRASIGVGVVSPASSPPRPPSTRPPGAPAPSSRPLAGSAPPPQGASRGESSGLLHGVSEGSAPFHLAGRGEGSRPAMPAVNAPVPASRPLSAMGGPAMAALHAPPPGSSPGIVPAVREGSAPALPALGGPAPVLSSIRLGAPIGAIDDGLLDRIDAVLRGFPEVEFACVGSAGGVNAFGLRIDARMRKRVAAIGDELGRVAPPGAGFYVLDDPDHFRAARESALVFFPWRRR